MKTKPDSPELHLSVGYAEAVKKFKRIKNPFDVASELLEEEQKLFKAWRAAQKKYDEYDLEKAFDSYKNSYDKLRDECRTIEDRMHHMGTLFNHVFTDRTKP